MPETDPTAPAPVTVPGYAAGAGDPSLALDRLRDAGWTRYEDGDGDVTYVSPDGAARAQFAPEIAPPAPLWAVAYTNPDPYAKNRMSWKATFGMDTPAEAIAAFVTALTDPAGLRADR